MIVKSKYHKKKKYDKLSMIVNSSKYQKVYRDWL